MKRNAFAIFLAVALIVALVFVVAPSAQAETMITAEAGKTYDITENGKTLDLNGQKNVTVNIAAGVTLSVVDSANTEMDGSTAGSLLKVGVGTIAPVAFDGNSRYLAVEENGAYSFHPFYLSITAIGLNTISEDICLRVSFAVNDIARSKITDYGIKKLTGEAASVSAAAKYPFGDKNGVHAYYDLDGSLAADKLDTTHKFQAYMVINGTEVVSNYIADITPRQVLKKINNDGLTPSDTQKAAIEAMAANAHLADLFTSVTGASCTHNAMTADKTAICKNCESYFDWTANGTFGDAIKGTQSAIALPAEISGNITQIIAGDGVYTEGFGYADGKLTLTAELADAIYGKLGYGEKALKLNTADGKSHNIAATLVTKAIGTFEELKSIAVTGNKLDGYFVLTDDIYCNGEHVHLVGAWTNTTTTGFVGTFDGRGHIIDGFNGESNRGLFYCTGAGVIKNVAFTNATGTVVLANGEIHGTTFENIFVSGSARFFTAATWDSPIYKNIIFMSTGSDPRMFDQGGTGNLTMTNVFTVGTAVRGYWNATATEANAKFFADEDALVAALGAEGELDVWTNGLFTVEDGKLLFNGKVVYKPVTTLTGPMTIVRGSSETYTSNGTITLKNAIDGVSIVDGVLTVDASVPADTVITLVATRNNDPSSAVELEVLVSVVYEQIDLTSKGSIGDLETSEAISYITLPSEIAGNVTGVSFGGYLYKNVSVADGKLAIPQEAVTLIYNACGYTEQNIQIYTADDKCYTITVFIATKAIGTFEELESIAVTGNKLDGYFVLTDDIYCEGKHVHLVGAWTNTTTTGFVGTFDGRGHIIDGFNGESNRGLFYCTGAGVIKNVAFTNATGTVVLANGEIHGTTFENIFVSGSARLFTAATWDSPIYKNVIFMSTGSDPRMFDQGGAGNLTMTNVFTVGTAVHGYWNATATEANAKFFADEDALVAALGAEGELDKWSGSGFSVEDGKLLFFGRVVIE